MGSARAERGTAAARRARNARRDRCAGGVGAHICTAGRADKDVTLWRIEEDVDKVGVNDDALVGTMGNGDENAKWQRLLDGRWAPAKVDIVKDGERVWEIDNLQSCLVQMQHRTHTRSPNGRRCTSLFFMSKT